MSQKIFCINLERDKDKWAKIQKDYNNKFKTNNFELVRFNAVNGRELTPEQLDKVFTKDIINHDNKGLFGAALSHIEIWTDIVGNGYPYGIIIEDDVVFDDDAETKLLETLNKLPPKNFDILFLNCGGLCGPQCRSIRNDKQYCKAINEDVDIPKYSFGGYAYIITFEGAKKMLERCFLVSRHIDDHMSNIYRKYPDQFKVYSLNKPFIKHPTTFETSSIDPPKYSFIPYSNRTKLNKGIIKLSNTYPLNFSLNLMFLILMVICTTLAFTKTYVPPIFLFGFLFVINFGDFITGNEALEESNLYQAIFYTLVPFFTYLVIYNYIMK
jgi:GR25 family glycosyltransferase involved in LPS biosynthesis